MNEMHKVAPSRDASEKFVKDMVTVGHNEYMSYKTNWAARGEVAAPGLRRVSSLTKDHLDLYMPSSEPHDILTSL